MKKTGTWRAVAVAAFALAMAAVLAGCPGTGNGGQVVEVTGVNVVADAYNPGLAGAGQGGQRNYFITVQGSAGVFPLNLAGPYVEVVSSVTGAPIDGITAMPGTVPSAGTPQPFSISANRPSAATYNLQVRVHGVLSNTFALPVVAPTELTGTVGLTGDPVLGQTLAANLDNLAGAPAEPIFQWERGLYPNFSAIDGATGATHTLVAADVNYTVRVAVGRAGFTGTIRSDPSSVVTDPGLPPLGGNVTIDMDEASIALGVTLTANVSGLTPDSAATLTFQWQRRPAAAAADAPFSPIMGESAASYTVTADDFDYVIRVIVGRHGYYGTVSSEPTAAVPVATVAAQLAALSAVSPQPATQTITAWVSEAIAPQTLSFASPITITLTRGEPGISLRLAEQGSMFTVGSNVTLVLDDITLFGLLDGTTILPNNRALIVVNSGGALEMESGSVIAGNSNPSGTLPTHGGGVRVNEGGVFSMNGGRIHINTGVWGGGVLNFGSFTMVSGLIDNNLSVNGGGVFNIGEDSTFTMYDGEIYDNTAQSNGGGVRNEGTFTMRGGEIHGNYAEGSDTAGGAGGGVFNITTFTMHGGTIHNNSAVWPSGTDVVSFGGGVLNHSIFTMHDGAVIQENLARHGGGVNNQSAGTFTMYDGAKILDNEGVMGGGLMAIGAVTMHPGSLIAENFASQGGGSLVIGNFIMNGEISGNYAIWGAGLFLFGSGVLTVTDGYISQNFAQNANATDPGVGGGVFNWGTVNIHGSTEFFNNLAFGRGGGINNEGIVNMHDGIFVANHTLGAGGGVYNSAAVGADPAGNFQIADGIILGTDTSDFGLPADWGNTAGDVAGASLLNAGNAEHGTFNGTFDAQGNLTTTNLTIVVEDGALIAPVAAAGAAAPLAAAGRLGRALPEGRVHMDARALLDRGRVLPAAQMQLEMRTLSAEDFSVTGGLSVLEMRQGQVYLR